MIPGQGMHAVQHVFHGVFRHGSGRHAGIEMADDPAGAFFESFLVDLGHGYLEACIKALDGNLCAKAALKRAQVRLSTAGVAAGAH